MNYLNCLNNVTEFEKSKEILCKKNLIIKNYDEINLYLVKYDKAKCDMSDSDVKKCRGLILEKNTNKLVCIPPLKSENISELENVGDFNSYSVEDFPDGTMINVFKYNNKLIISTRSNIGANCKYYSDKTFRLLFEESIDEATYKKLENIKEGVSLSFVLQHPENIIVSKYSKPDIVLVHGCFVEENKICFKSLEDTHKYLKSIDLHFKIPCSYKCNTIVECYEKIQKMNQYEQGLIIKYISNDNYKRYKIRNDYYNYVRDLKGNSNNKKYLYIELKRYNGLEEYFKYYPEDITLFESYRIELYNATHNLFNFYQDCFVRKDNDGNRKKYIKDIDYEYRPLCIELHNIYKKDRIKTDKRKVIYYMNNLPSAKILFVLNYKNYNKNKN
jgi:hypothetical protein